MPAMLPRNKIPIRNLCKPKWQVEEQMASPGKTQDSTMLPDYQTSIGTNPKSIMHSTMRKSNESIEVLYQDLMTEARQTCPPSMRETNIGAYRWKQCLHRE